MSARRPFGMLRSALDESLGGGWVIFSQSFAQRHKPQISHYCYSRAGDPKLACASRLDPRAAHRMRPWILALDIGDIALCERCKQALTRPAPKLAKPKKEKTA